MTQVIHDTDNYERCRQCGHMWHGLSCAVRATSLGTDGQIVHTTCPCPSQFKMEE